MKCQNEVLNIFESNVSAELGEVYAPIYYSLKVAFVMCLMILFGLQIFLDIRFARNWILHY